MRERWREVRLGDVCEISRARFRPSDHKPDAIVTLYSIPALDASGGPEVVKAGSIQSDKFGVATNAALISLLNPRIPRHVRADGGEMVACSTEFAVVRPASDDISLAFLNVLVSRPEFFGFLDSMAKGSTGSRKRAKAADVLSHEVWLPPLRTQRRIVDLIAAVDDAIEASAREEEATRNAYMAQLTDLFTSKVNHAPLGTALARSDDNVRVEPRGEYRLVGVLRSGEGFIDRGVDSGENIGYARLTRIGVDQLVYRKLTAWEGPISVSTEDQDGGFVSSEFPVFKIDESKLLTGLLRHYCRWPGLWSLMQQRLKGSVLRRMRLNPDQLEAIAVPMPSIAEQATSLQLLEAHWSAADAARAHADALRTLRSNLLTALLSGEHEIPSSYDQLLAAVDEGVAA